MPTSTPRVASISNIAWRFNSPPTQVIFTVTTDLIGKVTVAILPENAQVAAITVNESTSALGQRNITLALPAGSNGKAFRWTMFMVPDDTTVRTYPTDGGFRVPESRTVARGNALPVRFNTYGDGTRPASGGGIGNWSSYTWAQYNPKGTTYPTP